MKKPEKKLIETIHKIMKNEWTTDAVENLRGQGFSDYVFSCHSRHGFIEFKHRPKWPKRPDTIVTIDHYTKWQKAFLYRHGKHGNGGAFLCLQVERDVMFYNYHASQIIGNITKTPMMSVNLCTYTFNLPLLGDESSLIQSRLITTLTEH